MKQPAWRSTGNAVYQIQYHFVWSTKYRRTVLAGAVETAARRVLQQLCSEQGWEALALEVLPDHVHLFVSIPPAVSPAQAARLLKGRSAHDLFATHPAIKRRLWGGHLWNPSYYVGTAGQVSAEVIRRYIAQQKQHPQAATCPS